MDLLLIVFIISIINLFLNVVTILSMNKVGSKTDKSTEEIQSELKEIKAVNGAKKK
jgi:hypothetical protein